MMLPRPLFLLTTVSVGAMLSVGMAQGKDVPAGIFTLDHTTIGITTLDEIQKRYGRAEPSGVNGDEEADVAVCYVHRSAKAEAFVVFESGVMGGYTNITSFRLSRQRGSGYCVSTE